METEGKVMESRLGNIRINGIQQGTLQYRYQDHMGKFHTGETPISPEEVEAWQEGDSGKVRYDRNRPQESIWIGKL
jgi:hypothetical protein